jgi:zinc protease
MVAGINMFSVYRFNSALARRVQQAVLIATALLSATSSPAAIDLRHATVETLDNGLTLILLEDRRFPVVSVQALYRVGARDEVTGKTGLAHFL